MTLIKLINPGAAEHTLYDSSTLSPEDAIALGLEPLLNDIRKRSITPTTFHERAFEENTNNFWYMDQYQHDASHVTRFGLNKASDHIEASITHDKIPIIDLTAAGASSSLKTAKYTPELASKILLCSIERELLDRAIQYLLTDPTSPRTVLVDILERENGGANNGAVKFADGLPKTHTVILCNNQLLGAIHEILVIDPSNFLFSSHLSNFNQSNPSPHFVVKTIHKEIQIYKPGGDIGSAADNYRDCGDVAAKIAFGLNQIIHWQSLNDARSIKECAIIQNISNTDIDKSIIATMLPVRIKQSSDTQVVENFNRIEHLIMTNHDIILNLHKNNVSAIEECTKILRHVSENTISELCAHNSRCLKQIDDFCIQLHGDHDAFVHDAGII